MKLLLKMKKNKYLYEKNLFENNNRIMYLNIIHIANTLYYN